MKLLRTLTGEFIARTVYGEWEAKDAGFRWDRNERVWRTSNEVIAVGLASQLGLVIESEEAKRPVGNLWPAVNEGRYAINDPKDGVLKFYQVDKPMEGRWAGYTFLSVMASDDRWPIKDHATKAAILQVISGDPLKALARYGQEIGKCGHCGRTLTDSESRRIGIGPVCRGKLGMVDEEILDNTVDVVLK